MVARFSPAWCPFFPGQNQQGILQPRNFSTFLIKNELYNIPKNPFSEIGSMSRCNNGVVVKLRAAAETKAPDLFSLNSGTSLAFRRRRERDLLQVYSPNSNELSNREVPSSAFKSVIKKHIFKNSSSWQCLQV